MMAPRRSPTIGYPWIINSITQYKGGTNMLKAAPAQVIEFLVSPERTPDCQYPGAVVYISDRHYYIKAIITKEAHETLEREDENYTLARIKNMMVILKKFSLSFGAAANPRSCEFYLTIQHFCIIPMEINSVDLLYCNVEPGVVKKIKELWQEHMMELQMNDSSSDRNSDVSLTQLLMIASEEKLGELKSLAGQCLDLDLFATQEIAPQARTIWSTEIRNNKSNDNHFSIPINVLLIHPEEEKALDQMSDFQPDLNSAIDNDISNDGSDSSQQYSSALSTLSQEHMDDVYSSQTENPWNNLMSLNVSRSTSSATSDPSNVQQSSEKDSTMNSDVTPDLLCHLQNNSLNDSSESRISTLNDSKLQSYQDQPEILKSPNQAEPSKGVSFLTSSQRSLSDDSLLSLMPLTQDSPNQKPTSPQRDVSLRSELPISPILSHPSESTRGFKIVRNIFSPNSRKNNETCLSPREGKAVKRKQAPEDLDSMLFDLEEPIHIKRHSCVRRSTNLEFQKRKMEECDKTAETNINVECEKATETHRNVQCDKTAKTHRNIECDKTTKTYRNVECDITTNSNRNIECDKTTKTYRNVECDITTNSNRNIECDKTTKTYRNEECDITTNNNRNVECDKTTNNNRNVECDKTTNNNRNVECDEATENHRNDQCDKTSESNRNVKECDKTSEVFKIVEGNKTKTNRIVECIETTKNVNKTTNHSHTDKRQISNEKIKKIASTETAVSCRTTPLRKKILPYKPPLEFVTKPNPKNAENCENGLPAADLPTTSRTGSTDPPGVSYGQASTFQAPHTEVRINTMTHNDGKPFQYRYKPPSVDLCACVNAVRVHAALHEWAVHTLSEVKETNP